MNSEVKICQNCKQNFVIEPEDFQFYEKIQVPTPTFCPDCRLQRRMTWRNERTLYHTKCAATGKSVISMFDPESPIIVYDRDYWWSDNWDQLASGRDYDFSKPFFVQFRELLEKAPLPNLANTNVVNSDYGNHNADMKNCYLVFASFLNENISYASGAVEAKDSMDLYTVEKTEQCYENTLCGAGNRVAFSYDSDDCLDSSFLWACKNVSDCLGCINLKNKSYHIWNQPYTKEKYFEEIKNIDLGSYRNLTAVKEKFREFIKKYPRRYATLLKSVDTTGDMILNAKNSKHCFDIYDATENCKYVIHSSKIKDSYDCYGAGMGELFYEGVDSGIDASNYYFTIYAHKCRDIQYVYACHASDHLFGCVGLRNKKYCILNKQYTKEEYEELVPKIKKHMDEMPYRDKRGRIYKYGEFFPTELSLFAYNETIAQEYFPLTKEKAESFVFSWKNIPEKSYNITIEPKDLPDHIRDVKKEIVNEIIDCEHKGACEEKCTVGFKITPHELEFYRKFNYPLPRLCSNCRHFQRLALRNPFKLWHRKCMCLSAEALTKADGYQNTVKHPHHPEGQCPNEFETSYAPNRPEVVYCEACYNSEIV